nr:HeH/LEM domain-containing protein [uncultured Cellulosilyticum sp.]
MGKIVGLVFNQEKEVALNKLKVEDLKALCDKRGIEYDSKAKKDELVVLLDAYDKENSITEGAE